MNSIRVTNPQAMSEQSALDAIRQRRKLDIDCYYVAVDRREDGKNLIGIPISPYFQTEDEVRAFHNQCAIEGAYCIQCTHLVRDEEEARERKKCFLELIKSR